MLRSEISRVELTEGRDADKSSEDTSGFNVPAIRDG
jgi:hypothetical protein